MFRVPLRMPMPSVPLALAGHIGSCPSELEKGCPFQNRHHQLQRLGGYACLRHLSC